MILSHFRTWVRTAPAAKRAHGAGTLARAYLYGHLGEDRRREAEGILTEFLDDSSPLVRRALADALGGAAEAPHHIVLALSDDQADVAGIVLSRSPVLTDAELIDCAATAGPQAQAAIAARRDLSGPVSAAIAEIGAPPALVALAANGTASLPTFSLRRMVERHGDKADLREALLNRHDLPSAIRVEIVSATVNALAGFVTGRNWISGERMARIAAEAKEKATVTVAGAQRDGLAELVHHLRQSGRLTVGLALRAVLSGKLELFGAILAELSGIASVRVDSAVRRPGGAGFSSLYRRAGLPAHLLPAFRAALDGVRDADWTRSDLSRSAIQRVLCACDRIDERETGRLIALLRRFEAEAARDEVRADTRQSALVLSDRPDHPAHLQPLLLSDLDADDRRLTAIRAVERLPVRRRAVPYTVDLAAIEAQLCAA